MLKSQVLSELDVYSIVGANKPLQVVDIRASVGASREIVVRFESVCGSPIVNGICIKRATELPGIFFSFMLGFCCEFSLRDLLICLSSKLDKVSRLNCDYLVCNNCDAEIEISSPLVRYKLWIETI